MRLLKVGVDPWGGDGSRGAVADPKGSSGSRGGGLSPSKYVHLMFFVYYMCFWDSGFKEITPPWIRLLFRLYALFGKFFWCF